ncbi:MAG: hypothetical protein QOD11_2069 [Bradyrhizobium sp.]|nr:hypothetical protein [Bradyrhizobium sp.]
MRISPRFAASLAVAFSSIALLLCGLSGSEAATTSDGGASSLPAVVVQAPKQSARPERREPRPIARSTVSPRTSPTAAAPSTSPLSAKLARLASVTGSCVGGCATSFRSGNAPWHGCSVSGGMYSSTCRNTRNYKTYAECTEGGLTLGWRNAEAAWGCSSLGLK